MGQVIVSRLGGITQSDLDEGKARYALQASDFRQIVNAARQYGFEGFSLDDHVPPHVDFTFYAGHNGDRHPVAWLRDGKSVGSNPHLIYLHVDANNRDMRESLENAFRFTIVGYCPC